MGEQEAMQKFSGATMLRAHVRNIEEDKATIKKVLTTLNRYFNRVGSTNRAYVAGGWLRDYLLGVEPKDIDIFIASPSKAPFSTSSYTSNVLFDHYGWKVNCHLTSEYVENSSLREEVDYLLKYTSEDVDVIGMKTGLFEFLNNFDMSICQVYGELVDGEIKIYASKEFTDFKKDKIIHQYEHILQREDHVARVVEKYPDAQFVSTPSPSGEYIFMEKF